MTSPVLLARYGGMLLVTLNRPEKRIAFDLETRRALRAKMQDLEMKP